MNKAEFLDALCAHLSGLPQRDIDASQEYYSEIIDDRMEDGLSEEAAVEAAPAPTPEDILLLREIRDALKNNKE